MPRKITVTNQIINAKTLYGIVVEENGTTNAYTDITDSEEKIEQLKQNLEDSDISAVHIKDIIRDFITEEACDKMLANSLL